MDLHTHVCTRWNADVHQHKCEFYQTNVHSCRLPQIFHHAQMIVCLYNNTRTLPDSYPCHSSLMFLAIQRAVPKIRHAPPHPSPPHRRQQQQQLLHPKVQQLLWIQIISYRCILSVLFQVQSQEQALQAQIQSLH